MQQSCYKLCYEQLNKTVKPLIESSERNGFMGYIAQVIDSKTFFVSVGNNLIIVTVPSDEKVTHLIDSESNLQPEPGNMVMIMGPVIVKNEMLEANSIVIRPRIMSKQNSQ